LEAIIFFKFGINLKIIHLKKSSSVTINFNFNRSKDDLICWNIAPEHFTFKMKEEEAGSEFINIVYLKKKQAVLKIKVST
jgi:hypothetical protein